MIDSRRGRRSYKSCHVEQLSIFFAKNIFLHLCHAVARQFIDKNHALRNLEVSKLFFGLSDNFGAGVMTSWLGVPIIGALKYNYEIAPNVNIGVGALLGSMTWVLPSAWGVMGFGAITYGDANSNINFAGGYAVVSESNNSAGAPVFSFGAMGRLGKRITVVGDSFYFNDGITSLAVIAETRLRGTWCIT